MKSIRKNKEKLKWVNMILSEGMLDLLEFMKDEKPKYFKQLEELKNERTGSKYSPTTISTRLKELIKTGLVEREITKTETGRGVAGYKITGKGIKTLKILYECETKLGYISNEK